MYRLRAQVAIEAAGDTLAVLAVFGDGAAERLGLPAVAGATRSEGGTLGVDPRLAELGARVVLPAGAVAAFAAAHDLTPAPFAAYDRHRLVLGVPDGSRDLSSTDRCCWRAASRS